MVAEASLLAVLVASLIGALLGFLTGLVPGLHSNNVASMVGASPGVFVCAASLGTVAPGGAAAGLVASSAVVACAVAHTVSSIVPSIFLAAPEGDTALSVLPGHRMLRAGRGMEALRISVVSSLVALAVSLVLVVPVRLLMAPPGNLYHLLWGCLGPGLLLVSAVMIVRERGRDLPRRPLRRWHAVAAALGVFLAAGLLGHATVFSADGPSPGDATGTMAFASLFIGLFGLPTLILAIKEPVRVAGADEDKRDAGRAPMGPVLRGTLAGAVVGWLPGVSSAQATILAVPRDAGEGAGDLDGSRRFIAGVSAVNTANAVFNLVALATFLRVRSGAAAAVSGITGWTEAPWADGALPGTEVAVLLLAVAVAGAVAAPLTLAIGRPLSKATPVLGDRRVLLFILLTMSGIIIAWGGLRAGLLMATATALGLVPPLLGLMRVHLMGVLTLPLAISLLAM